MPGTDLYVLNTECTMMNKTDIASALSLCLLKLENEI